MEKALALAAEAAAAGEVPVGAVVVRDGEVVGEGRNRIIERGTATDHAEMLAFAEAKSIKPMVETMPMSQVNEALSVANLEYHGSVRVRHLVEVLFNDVTPEVIAARVKRGLNGLKVAPYYGCQLVRPDYGFDDPENPRSLDLLVESLGAEAVPFPLKNRCCGGSLA